MCMYMFTFMCVYVCVGFCPLIDPYCRCPNNKNQGAFVASKPRISKHQMKKAAKKVFLCVCVVCVVCVCVCVCVCAVRVSA